jgi:Na+-transporting NADH:ubiquinone oxidoreductase subunit A
MANVIKLRKGLNINLKGKPAKELLNVKPASVFALMPEDFTGLVPKVVVKEGDSVKAGDALFVDKKHPEVKFVSPVSGTVLGVDRGERRKVLAVRVQADGEQTYVDFGKKEVSVLTSEEVKASLLEAGLFAFIQQRPYDVVADPTTAPKAIFISAFDSKPLAPEFEFILNGQEADFQTGLDALSKIAPVNLGVSAAQSSKALIQASNATVTIFDGPHPAGNVGVQIHHVNPINKGELVWTLGAEEVIFIGRLFRQGKVDFTRTIALAGSEVKHPAYCKMIIGSQLTNLLQGAVNEGKVLRFINGNVLTGRVIAPDAFLGAKANEVTVIPEGTDVHELFGWIMPRFNEYSTSHSYFSWLFGKKKEYTLDARVKGGERHMIMSNEYDKVFPMDILPEYLVKAIIAGDIDRMEALGIYEVAPEDFALCEFVDSSKLELQRIVREGLDALRAEMC